MGRNYKVTGSVTIRLDLTTEFTDDGKLELLDQAVDALGDHDDIPLSMVKHIQDVAVERIWEV